MPDFEAFWIPDPESWDEYWPPDVGVTWLHQRRPPRALVVPSVPQADDLWGLPAGIEVVTPRNRYRRRPTTAASILVCYPCDKTLELADDLRPTAVCVADNSDDAVRAWVAQHDAVALVPADWEGKVSDHLEPSLPAEVMDELRFVIDFDSHNQFIGAGGKEHAIRALRRINEAHATLAVEDVRVWLLSQPEVRARGAERLCTWLNEIRAGVRHLGYNRRPIV